LEDKKMVLEINENEFDEKTTEKCVVPLTTTWCGTCKMLSPEHEELSKEMKDVAFYKVDADVSVELGSDFDIVTVPTLIVFQDGKVVNRASGFMNKEKLKDFIRAK